jgi:predicted membrane channel-forming protein YqfA (hemolysin III family)
MYKDSTIVTLTFLFNILTIFVFSIIYSSISPHNFEPLNPKDKLNYVDYLFYSITIQCGVGLPDVTALSDLAKILAMIQQVILMGSAFILLQLFLS